MTCPRCGAELEPIPDVGWACLNCMSEAVGGERMLTITAGPKGLAIDAGGMSSTAVLRILEFAHRIVTAGVVRAAQKAAQEN